MREDALSHTLPQSEFGRQGSNRDFVMYPLRNARKYARNSFPGGTGASDCRSGTKTRIIEEASTIFLELQYF